MKTHLQFGLRENTASSRQHASRPAASSSSDVICVQDEPTEVIRQSASIDDSTTVFRRSCYAASRCAATGGRDGTGNPLLTVHEVAQLLRVPVSWVYGRTRRRSKERLPGYRLGKYWRFSESDVLAWIERQRSITR